MKICIDDTKCIRKLPCGSTQFYHQFGDILSNLATKIGKSDDNLALFLVFHQTPIDYH